MLIKFGNLSPEGFAAQVGAEFTEAELGHLKTVWSQNATLTSAEDFHIFDDPTISIHIGAADSETVRVFQAANSRIPFNREVMFYADYKWKVTANAE